MKTRSFTSLVLTIILCYSLPLHAYAASTCRASSVLGGDCTVTCPGAYTAYCDSGFFGATCTCLAAGQLPPARVLPSPTGQQFTDSQVFESWAASYGSTGMTSLSGLVDPIVTAVNASDFAAWESAEAAFWNQYGSLSNTEKSAITSWKTTHGY